MLVRIPTVVPETPVWADTFGVDTYGVFAGLTVHDVPQLFRWIEPGDFVMGSPDGELGRYEAEKLSPALRFTIGFWMAETPVTQAFYEAVTGVNPSHFKGDSRRPVEQVSWHDAMTFCERLAQRCPELSDFEVGLPIEAFWEYACRAGTQAALYSGNELTSETGACPNLDELAWYDENSEGTTHPVREKLPNAWGRYDMLGNVWEWCHDKRWDRNYEGASADRSAKADERTLRVVRGGCWDDIARFCRSAYRFHFEPGFRYGNLGFRLVLSPRSGGDGVMSDQ